MINRGHIVITILWATLFMGCSGSKQTSSLLDKDLLLWKFKPGDGVDSLWHKVEYDDNHWAEVVSDKPLVEQGISLERGFGWYRKRMRFSESEQKQISESGAAIINLGRFAACEEVYINGKLIGKTGEFPDNYAGYYDHIRTYYVAAEELDLAGDNLLAIKFHDGWSSAGGFVGGNELSITAASVLEKIELKVEVKDDDYIFLGSKGILVEPKLWNRGNEPVRGLLSVKLLTDDRTLIKNDTTTIIIPGKETYQGNMFGVGHPDPGFYRYDISFSLSEEEEINQQLVVGYEPEKIISPNDQPVDFDAYWDRSLEELSKISPDFDMTLIPEQSKADYDMYQVSMRSFENELISGYYAQPKEGSGHPVIVEYMGYGSEPYFPNQTWDGFAYFVLSVRGQALNKPTNRFGTWFTYGIDNKDSYYYRGAYMDVVRALDFVCSRPELDSTKIVVRGSSQGGALSVAAAALDDRVKALAVGIPFLSDFRDYFAIASWPRSDVEQYMNEHPEISWEQIYTTLSYIDIKNLASRIKVPLLMGIGVQDEVCPPHINFAAYNQVKSPKSWMAFGSYGHSTGSEFHEGGLALFRKVLNISEL